MGRRAGVAAVLAFALTACGRLLGVGDDDAPAPAPVPVVDVDGGGDSAGGEVVVDAAAATHFCATVDAAFCEDFDRVDAGPSTVPSGWAAFQNDGNGHAIVAEGRSLPNAFTLQGTGAFYAEGYVEVMRAGAQSVEIDFVVAVDALPAPTLFLQFTWNAPEERHGFTINLSESDNSTLEEILGPAFVEARQAALLLKSPEWKIGWNAVSLHVDWNANVADVLVQGKSIGSTSMAWPFTPGSLYVELGAHRFDIAADPKRIRYDDVVVRAR